MFFPKSESLPQFCTDFFLFVAKAFLDEEDGFSQGWNRSGKFRNELISQLIPFVFVFPVAEIFPPLHVVFKGKCL
ncbi:hypothetical protein D3C86_2085650 [compost metagenome]